MSWKEGFAEICKKTHSEQAKFWLNGFWAAGADKQADEIWKITHSFIELDIGHPVLYGGKMKEYKENCDLDEMKAHVILEKLGETMTVKELRARLTKLDLDNNKRMALSEYLLDKYKKKPEDLVNSPQGDLDPAVLKAAEDSLAAAGKALDQASADADAAAAALLAVQAAEAELKTAVAALDAEEASYKAKIKTFEDLAADPSLSAMKKAKANNELAQLKGEDPMPLRKAKITQGAALKKVEKEVKKSEEAKATALAAKQAAADAVKKAEEDLVNLKKKGGNSTPQGVLYWMDRTLKEKKKFMR